MQHAGKCVDLYKILEQQTELLFTTKQQQHNKTIIELVKLNENRSHSHGG